jgi:hypothetical protein
MVFRTVPPANTLIRWVDERRLRPHSAGSTRSHLRPTGSSRGGPHRLRPGTSPHALRIPPRGGHPALRVPRGGFRPPLAVSGFRLRARVGFAIPSSPRPARHYPRVRIRRPSSGRRRDLNPPDHHAAQRTLWGAPIPCGPSRRASVSFARRYHAGAPVFVSPLRPDAGLGPGVLGCGHPLGRLAGGVAGRPKFLGNPHVPLPCSRTPAGSEPPGHKVARRGPRLAKTEGYPRVSQSRGSMARLQHSLSVLHQSRPFSEGDARLSVGKASGDVCPALVHGLDVLLSLASGATANTRSLGSPLRLGPRSATQPLG